jgi:hypothetical protein
MIDATRTWVVTGRERHVGSAREDNLPYPHRALRTKEFLYVRNSTPDRWPLGSPKFTSRADLPKFEDLEKVTYAAFADMDASPTKAWVVHHFDDPRYKWVYDYAFGKRPAEELYDLARGPGPAQERGRRTRLRRDAEADVRPAPRHAQAGRGPARRPEPGEVRTPALHPAGEISV